MCCVYLYIYLFSPPDTSSIPSPQPHTFQINFNSLYTALCEQQRSDQVTLLLYTLLHQNSNMKTYMLSRTDMENLVSARAGRVDPSPFVQLEFFLFHISGIKTCSVYSVSLSVCPSVFPHQVIPILEILYHVEDRNSHHVYMALIILLILTEDDTFNRSIHEVVSTRVSHPKH